VRGRTYHSQNRDMALMVLTYNIMLIWHAMKGFLQSNRKLFILRQLGEQMRLLGKEAAFYMDRKPKFRILCGSLKHCWAQ